ncbi:putative beta-lactamase-like 1 [Tachyglossus aculeatus]|uniref:putative beta-lactamase-like 1 n=1 Tax=Tachyglossus aculeatus TaxID=9261 RepID=UPI0018F56FAB|nr:putative beta-lactamase-like 1 [Tachyglossus aculeatus]
MAVDWCSMDGRCKSGLLKDSHCGVEGSTICNGPKSQEAAWKTSEMLLRMEPWSSWLPEQQLQLPVSLDGVSLKPAVPATQIEDKLSLWLPGSPIAIHANGPSSAPSNLGAEDGREADRGPRMLTMKGRWLPVLSCGFFLLSVVMTGCFLWQYQIAKMESGPSGMGATPATVRMCPRYPEPVPLDHPLPILRKALEKVDRVLCQASEAGPSPGHTAISAIVIYNDMVLWTGNFGKKNSSDPSSEPPNEYTVYRIASVSKLFPTLMLYQLWEEGKLRSLDDPLELYAQSFSIKNPLGGSQDPGPGVSANGPGSRPLHPSSVTLRRMASQLSGPTITLLIGTKAIEPKRFLLLKV